VTGPGVGIGARVAAGATAVGAAVPMEGGAAVRMPAVSSGRGVAVGAVPRAGGVGDVGEGVAAAGARPVALEVAVGEGEPRMAAVGTAGVSPPFGVPPEAARSEGAARIAAPASSPTKRIAMMRRPPLVLRGTGRPAAGSPVTGAPGRAAKLASRRERRTDFFMRPRLPRLNAEARGHGCSRGATAGRSPRPSGRPAQCSVATAARTMRRPCCGTSRCSH
jgi:hypothetical protein